MDGSRSYAALRVLKERFTCDACHRSFTKAWTDAEAIEEAERFFGYEVPRSQQRELCDECYEAFTQWVETLTPEERFRLDAEALSAGS